MTFAELVIFAIAAFCLYLVLKPFQRRLETFFYKFFRRRGSRTVIDITPPKDKDKK